MVGIDAMSHDIEDCLYEKSSIGSTWVDHPENGSDLGPRERNGMSKP